ncbi:MAG: DUF4214 domain-containing protein [Candidatus Sumerlaeia bacterium]|nr:DUF4214 domain-containing protein [Candidatus Sumerlaeia bacterium]
MLKFPTPHFTRSVKRSTLALGAMVAMSLVFMTPSDAQAEWTVNQYVGTYNGSARVDGRHTVGSFPPFGTLRLDVRADVDILLEIDELVATDIPEVFDIRGTATTTNGRVRSTPNISGLGVSPGSYNLPAQVYEFEQQGALPSLNVGTGTISNLRLEDENFDITISGSISPLRLQATASGTAGGTNDIPSVPVTGNATLDRVGEVPPPHSITLDIESHVGDITLPYDESDVEISGIAAAVASLVSTVEWRLNGGDWQGASGTEAWNFLISDLPVGTSLLEVRSRNNYGLTSMQLARAITRQSAPATESDLANAAELLEDFYFELLGRAPESGAIEIWMTGVSNALVQNVDIRFIGREIARVFVFSEEYVGRERTRQQFILDCYAAFLGRVPGDMELEGWSGDSWNQGQALSTFLESEEFANRMNDLFPGREGNPVHNFVNALYIGVLNRTVDPGGMQYWASQFVASEDPRQRARDMFFHLSESQEFLDNDPSVGDYVTSLYRSFMNRFPGDHEVDYWSGEIVNGNQTLDEVVDFFSNSQEFTNRLVAHGLIEPEDEEEETP